MYSYTVDPDKFWSNVDIRGADECWPWKLSCDDDGYGHIVVRDKTGKRHWTRANRVALELKLGRPLLRGMKALHRCDNPRCCNINNHLFEGTHKDNMRDMKLKRRAAYGRRNGTHTRPASRARGNRNGARLHPETLVRGESHPGSKLTESDVREIVHLYQSGTSQRELARRKEANQSTIQAILSGRTWVTVTGGKPVVKGKPLKP
jgi:hypothetical protein